MKTNEQEEINHIPSCSLFSDFDFAVKLSGKKNKNRKKEKKEKKKK